MPGGMGGMGRMMGGNGGVANNPGTDCAPSPAEYDLDRWKRAESGEREASSIEQVRAYHEGDKKRGMVAFFARFKKSKNPGHRERPKREPEPEKPAVSVGTINYMQTKPAPGKADEKQAAPKPKAGEPADETIASCPIAKKWGEPNYLNLTTSTNLDSFMTSNPINSAYLAIDSLSLSGLCLNQISPPRNRPAGPVCRHCHICHETQNPSPSLTEERSDSYMDAHRQSMEQRKYEVRIAP